MELFLLVFVAPAAFGYVLGRLGPKGDLQGCGLSLAAALIPGVALAVMSQQADSISAAAAVGIIPFVLAFMCMPAMVGVAIARYGKDKL